MKQALQKKDNLGELNSHQKSNNLNLIKNQEEKTQKQENEQKDEQALEEGKNSVHKKDLHLSKGFAQLTSEGEFSGHSDCRKPHFPGNVYLFTKANEEARTALHKNWNDKKPSLYNKNGGGDKDGEYTRKRLPMHSEIPTPSSGEFLKVSNNSGVTIGFGIDLGHRYHASDTLIASKFLQLGGIEKYKSDILAETVSLKGLEAAKKIHELRQKIEITSEQAVSLLDHTISGYETEDKYKKKDGSKYGYTTGEGEVHPALHELITYAAYWGEKKLWRALVEAGQSSESYLEQFDTALSNTKKARNEYDEGHWKRPGYKKVIASLETFNDVIKSGGEISISDEVLDIEELKGEGKTLEYVRDTRERADDYQHNANDMTAALDGEARIDVISKAVGKGAPNLNKDVRVIQRLLYNGKFYEGEVSGNFDEATGASLASFMQKDIGKTYDTIDPNQGSIRKLKKYRYSFREELKDDQKKTKNQTKEEKHKKVLLGTKENEKKKAVKPSLLSSKTQASDSTSEVATGVSASVGYVDSKKGNIAKDVLWVQDKLLAFGILSDADYATEKATGNDNINKNTIPKTLKSIQNYQETVQHYSRTDQVVGDGGEMEKSLASMTPELAATKIKQYPAVKAKREKEAKRKADLEAAELAKKNVEKDKIAADKKKEEERIEAIKNQKTDEGSLQQFIDKSEVSGTFFNSIDYENLGEKLVKYVVNNPEFVKKVIQKSSGFVNENTDEIAYHLVKNCTDAQLKSVNQDLKDYLYDCMDWGLTDDNDEKQMKRLKGEEKKEEVKEEIKNQVKEMGLDEKDADDSFKEVENIIKVEDYRTQNPDNNTSLEDSEASWTACKYISEKMVYRHLYKDELNLDKDKEGKLKTFSREDALNNEKIEYKVGSTGSGEFLSLLREDKEHVKDIKNGKRISGSVENGKLEVEETASLALKYINRNIQNGIPVVVGVDHTYNRSLEKIDKRTSSKNTIGYNEGTTDHFITLIGSGTDNQGKYYTYYDPGTQQKAGRSTEDNRLYEKSKGVWIDNKNYSGKEYHLTMVILFKKDIEEYKKEINKNKSLKNKLENSFNNKTGNFKYRNEK